MYGMRIGLDRVVAYVGLPHTDMHPYPPTHTLPPRCLPWWRVSGTCATTTSLAGLSRTSSRRRFWRSLSGRRRRGTWPGGCGGGVSWPGGCGGGAGPGQVGVGEGCPGQVGVGARHYLRLSACLHAHPWAPCLCAHCQVCPAPSLVDPGPWLPGITGGQPGCRDTLGGTCCCCPLRPWPRCTYLSILVQ